MDILELIEFHLSEIYFVYINVIWTLEDSGPISLSVMVILSAVMLIRFADDSHARFEIREQSRTVQLKWIQYKITLKNKNKVLSFLDVTITNTRNDSYDFKVFSKTSITKVQTKLKYSRVFKKFLWQAYKISTEIYLQSKASINEKATIKTGPRTLKYHGCQLRKEFKRKDRELMWNLSCITIILHFWQNVV